MSHARPAAKATEFPDRDDRVAVVAARWNDNIVGRLLDGCLGRVEELGARATVARVPGAFELPLAAKLHALTGQYAAVICLGCVIRGDTPHFDYVAGECARGVMRVGLETAVPTVFGVLTVLTEQQALDRTDPQSPHGHAGISAAEVAAEMATLRHELHGG